MNIGVNSRLLQNSLTGIPYFIKNLYEEMQAIDTTSTYSFFQMQSSSIKIGNTVMSNPPTPIKSLNNMLFDTMIVGNLISQKNINIFHSPAYILPLQKRGGVKHVLTIHDVSYLIFPQNETRLFNMYYKYALPHSLKQADVIVADSQNTRKDIIKFYAIPEKKIRVVYLGIDGIFFKKKATKRLINQKYFLTVTTHPIRKNIFRILEIMSMNKMLKEYTFVIAGLMSSQHLVELRKKIAKLGIEKHTHLYGYATEENLVSLYQHAEFFIYPSYYEGFGFPVLEAMACQCPVVSSSGGSLAEILPSKEWQFDPYDEGEITRKMQSMLQLSDRSRTELVESNYQYAIKFTWKKTAEQYLTIFNSLYEKS